MRVLIIGKRSYIGSKAKSHLEVFGHTVDESDAENGEWERIDFSVYDSVVHVAAIVHQNSKTADEALFKKVNTELPVSVAEKCRSSGVRQFVFLSTMGVYGIGKTLSTAESVITATTPLSAVGGYGGSKLEAEKRLSTSEDDAFKVAIIRPPNVYGPGCRGNYIPLFRKLALSLGLCPYAFTEIRQSMLYIDNLSELIRLIVENLSSGIFLPQDDIAPNTVELIHIIRDVHHKKSHDSKLLGGIVKLFRFLPPVAKIYGGIRYDSSLSDCFDYRYRIVGFADGMQETYRE